jgi:hypothetical protein
MTRNWKHTSTLALHPTFSLSKSAHSVEAETSLKLETIWETARERLHSCPSALSLTTISIEPGRFFPSVVTSSRCWIFALPKMATMHLAPALENNFLWQRMRSG